MIYLFLAPGFEETEAICTLDLIKRGGIEVKTVAVGCEGLAVTSTRGITVLADLSLADAQKELPCGVVLPGGLPGADNLNVPAIHEILHAVNKQGGLLSAICAAPYVFGGQGLLQGKAATCYPGFEERLVGAEVKKAPVVRDGNVITAMGMGASVAFGLAIVEYFKGKEAADSIKAAIFA